MARRKKPTIDDGPPEDIDAALVEAYDETRALDAKIAQHVFGWRWQRFDCHFVESLMIPPERATSLKPEYVFDYPPVKRLSQIKNFPEYSTDIAAAFEVVEKILNSNPPVYRFSLKSRPGMWLACFSHWADRDRKFEETGTIPEAICRAALMVVKERETS